MIIRRHNIIMNFTLANALCMHMYMTLYCSYPYHTLCWYIIINYCHVCVKMCMHVRMCMRTCTWLCLYAFCPCMRSIILVYRMASNFHQVLIFIAAFMVDLANFYLWNTVIHEWGHKLKPWNLIPRGLFLWQKLAPPKNYGIMHWSCCEYCSIAIEVLLSLIARLQYCMAWSWCMWHTVIIVVKINTVVNIGIQYHHNGCLVVRSHDFVKNELVCMHPK
jgi:hypothetical protein